MKNLYIYLAIAALISIQYSCKKDLNAPPSQALVEGNVVVDQKSAENVLSGAYSRFVGTSTRFNFLGHNWSQNQEIPPSILAGLIRYGFGTASNDLYNNNLLPSQTTFYWTYPYTILNAANATITEVGALPDASISPISRKTEIIAEARFLRAYAHWMLLGYFSEWNKLSSPYGVLLRKEPLKLSNAAYPRSTVQESYDFILQDLDFAIANAADVRPNYYVNKTAAKALKMRVLMMKGQAADHTQTITLANEIIANPAYQLEPNLRDLFQVKGLTSKEVILGITPYPNQAHRRGTYEFIQSSVYVTAHDFRNLLAGDPRSTWMFTKATNSTVASIRDSFYLSKYFGPKVEDAYAIRLTEVHLLKSEALVRSGGSMTEAKNILKNIVARAGVTDFTEIDNANTPNQVLVEIYKEVARNMVAENGAEWFTLIRLPFAIVNQLRPSITDPKQLYFPVPLTEFQLNPSFGPQNPGY
jgi:starch-binding outer membrane protein, SusD/RagB family